MMEHLDRALEILVENGYTPLEIHFPRSDLWEMLRIHKLDTIRQYKGLQVFFLDDKLKIHLGENLWGRVTDQGISIYTRDKIFLGVEEKEITLLPLTNHDAIVR